MTEPDPHEHVLHSHTEPADPHDPDMAALTEWVHQNHPAEDGAERHEYQVQRHITTLVTDVDGGPAGLVTRTIPMVGGTVHHHHPPTGQGRRFDADDNELDEEE